MRCRRVLCRSPPRQTRPHWGWAAASRGDAWWGGCRCKGLGRLWCSSRLEGSGLGDGDGRLWCSSRLEGCRLLGHKGMCLGGLLGGLLWLVSGLERGLLWLKCGLGRGLLWLVSGLLRRGLLRHKRLWRPWSHWRPHWRGPRGPVGPPCIGVVGRCRGLCRRGWLGWLVGGLVWGRLLLLVVLLLLLLLLLLSVGSCTRCDKAL